MNYRNRELVQLRILETIEGERKEEEVGYSKSNNKRGVWSGLTYFMTT